MPGTNLHIFPTNISNQTRLFKEAQFTLANKLVDDVVVIGLWHTGQLPVETLDSGLRVIRVQTLFRKHKDSWVLNHIMALRKLAAGLALLKYIVVVLILTLRLRPQHVSCHYVTTLPLVWLAARISGATLEYLPHELETQRSGLGGWRKKIDTWIERRFIHKARNVVVVCDPIRDWYRDAYGLTNLHVIRNVPERAAVTVQPVPGGGFRQIFAIPDSAKVFIYQGIISAGRGIELMLDIFSRLDPQKSQLVLMGYCEGDSQSRVEDAATRHSNIHFHPAVARDWIVSYSATADVGILLPETRSLSYRYSLPNKFFEWAHAGLPVLVNDGLEYQAKILAEGNFGWVAAPEDMVRMVKEISETDTRAFSQNGKEYSKSAVWEIDAEAFRHVYRPSQGEFK